MASQSEEVHKVSRRSLLKGLGAGAVVAGVAVAGVEELRIAGLAPSQACPADVTAALTASPGSIVEGGNVRFDATPGGGTSPYTLAIDCGDGTTLTASGTHAYSAAGKYVALLTVTDSNGKKGMATAAVTVTAQSTVPTVGPLMADVVTLNINNTPYTLQVQSNWTLLEVLRNQFHLFSVKEGCGMGECGSCTVIVDGQAVNSCQILAIEAEGKKIVTLEGISDYGLNLHPLQTAWMNNHATQCGYCASGQILSAKALLDANPHPTVDQIREALAGNLCVCGNYKKITQAVASVGGA